MLVQGCAGTLCFGLSWRLLWDTSHPTPSHSVPPHPLGLWAPATTLTLGITLFQRENLLKGQKEEEERLLKAIPLFCFPDGNNWAPVTEFTRYLPHRGVSAVVSHPVLPYP